jgi:hypothetical protein
MIAPDDRETRADPLSGYDSMGIVLGREGRILRGIHAGKVDEARRLLDCGLIGALERESLFPATWISDVTLPEFGLTIEHQRLHPLVFAGEWTFEMLRDAALALLEINRIARAFGYETKDAHLYNFCFVGTRPVFFDLGSFVRRPGPRAGWSAYDEFVRGVLYPLSLGAQAGPALTRMLLDFGLERTLTYEDYVRLRAGMLAKWLPCATIARLRWMYGGFLALGWSDGRAARLLLKDRRGQRVLRWLQETGLLEFFSADFARLERRVRRIGRRARAAGDGLSSGFAGDVPAQRVCDIAAGLGVGSVVELGGKTGALSLALVRRGIVRSVTCADHDAGAVEAAYALFKRHGEERCTAAVIDFLEDSRSIRMPSAAERYRAELVIVLGLTHYLVLRRGVQPSLLMQRIAAFCSDYAVVEFLPWGLARDEALARPPSWYGREWFRRHFLVEFDPIEEVEVAPNSVLFVGRKHRRPPVAAGSGCRQSSASSAE